MPELDYEAENVRLNAYLEKLEDAQDALATAGINDSAKWEQERDALIRELDFQKGANEGCMFRINEQDDEIATLRAILRDLDKAGWFYIRPDLYKRIQDALLKE